MGIAPSVKSSVVLPAPTGQLVITPLAGDAEVALSLVVPTFNEIENLREFLAVVRTTLDEALPGRYEVIVVDDGSSDATGAIVEEYLARDARFHLLRQRNAGVGAARNTAILKASGKYFASAHSGNRSA